MKITDCITAKYHTSLNWLTVTPLLTNGQDNSLVSMQTSHFQSQTKTCAPTKCQQHHICC